jgi:hypothetical protein
VRVNRFVIYLEICVSRRHFWKSRNPTGAGITSNVSSSIKSIAKEKRTSDGYYSKPFWVGQQIFDNTPCLCLKGVCDDMFLRCDK